MIPDKWRVDLMNERSYALSRVALSVAATMYFYITSLATGMQSDSVYWSMTVGSAGYSLLAVAFFFHVNKFPDLKGSFRKILGALLDMSILSAGMYVGGEAGGILYPVMLWVLGDIGMRFGMRYLTISVIAGVVGFLAVIISSDFWSDKPVLGTGLLVGIALVPALFAGLIQKIHDINESLKREMNDKAYAATHDALTGLPNRVLFQERLIHTLEMSKRKNTHFALMFLDIDRFKYVNDTYGHACGDQLLQVISSRLTTVLRKSDTVARLGGDEFVVILSEITSAQDAEFVANKIISEVAKKCDVIGKEFTVTTSIGISVFPHHGSNVSDIIKNADVAMYAAKDAGKNTYRIYDEKMNWNSRKILDTETALRHGIKNREFHLHLQPKVCMRTKKIIGAEALLRWNRDGVGMVPPNEFLPLAEETGIIVDLGNWIIEDAIRISKKIRERCGVSFPISVNVSPVQFSHPSFLETIKRHAADIQGLIEFEVTESVYINNTDQLMMIFRFLRNIGIAVSIDDFGTGYSSLSYLKRFFARELKIDLAFIKNMENSDGDRALVRAIINIGKEFGMRIVAEGVETKGQESLLTEMGCDIGQGWLYSKALPEGDFVGMISGDCPVPSDNFLPKIIN